MLRVIWEFSGFALPGCVISLENSDHFLNQSESKLKRIATCSLAFSRASSSLLVFTHFDFSLVPPDIFLTVIGCCAYYSFGLRHSVEERSIRSVYFFTEFCDCMVILGCCTQLVQECYVCIIAWRVRIHIYF